MVDIDAIFCLNEQLVVGHSKWDRKKKKTWTIFQGKRTKVKKNTEHLLLKRRSVIQHKNES